MSYIVMLERVLARESRRSIVEEKKQGICDPPERGRLEDAS